MGCAVDWGSAAALPAHDHTHTHTDRDSYRDTACVAHLPLLRSLSLSRCPCHTLRDARSDSSLDAVAVDCS